jgi:hypothetical protein
LNNFGNYAIEVVQDYLKDIALCKKNQNTFDERDQDDLNPKYKVDRKEDFTTLKMLWNNGDLSFAADLSSYDYIHRSKNNINLSLGATSQMSVSISNLNFLCMKYISTYNTSLLMAIVIFPRLLSDRVLCEACEL